MKNRNSILLRISNVNDGTCFVAIFSVGIIAPKPIPACNISKAKENKRAFFLLEVMLTVVILSIGLVFVIRSITMSLGVAKQAFNYGRAIHFVYEKASELELAPEYHTFSPGEYKEDSGVFESDNNFRWKYVAEKLDEYNITSLLVDVSWKEGRREGTVGIATYLSPYNVTQ